MSTYSLGAAVDGTSVITSLPDSAEIPGMPMDEWRNWFIDAAALCIRMTGPDHKTIFYQTDRKTDGETISKVELLQTAARRWGRHLLWHKIVLRTGVGVTSIRRPGYSHLMAFSLYGRPGRTTPDVIAPSQSDYRNGIGIEAVAFIALAAIASKPSIVVDPFCGRGSLVWAAARLGGGIEAIGLDIDPLQIEEAEKGQGLERQAELVRSAVLRLSVGDQISEPVETSDVGGFPRTPLMDEVDPKPSDREGA